MKIVFTPKTNPRLINEKLVARREQLIDRLFTTVHIKYLPNGDIRIGKKGSLCIKANGQWYSFEDGVGGDLLELARKEWQLSFHNALYEADHFIRYTSPDESSKSRLKHKAEWSSVDSKALAERFWRDANRYRNQEYITQYLKHRGINLPLETIWDHVALLPALDDESSGADYPCLVTQLLYADGNFAGILRTFLTEDCKSKAPIENPKRALGNTRGAAMQLCKVKKQIYIVEGLENALSLMQMYPKICVWGYVGSSILSCEFPNLVKKIVIATDADDAGEKYRQKLSRRLISQGYEVDVLIPSGGNDFNEMLRKGMYV